MATILSCLFVQFLCVLTLFIASIPFQVEWLNSKSPYPSGWMSMWIIVYEGLIQLSNVEIEFPLQILKVHNSTSPHIIHKTTCTTFLHKQFNLCRIDLYVGDLA